MRCSFCVPGVSRGVFSRWIGGGGPKWEIQQASFPDQRYRLTLRMDRIYAGGAGEARAVFHHRAEELMRQNGYDGYQVIEYTESIESSILASQRMAQGTIQLTRK